jgi:sulfite dehydrogenase
MDVDSTIFFPGNNTAVQTRVPLEIGGAAFGGTRISTVEITTDGGDSWQQSEIVQSMDADNVWVFWKATVIFRKPGSYKVYSRATDIHGNVQPENDSDSLNGTNRWPSVTIQAVLLKNTSLE